MNIITAPWIAVDLGTDRIHVAYLAAGEARSVQPANGEFDSVFHVSPDGVIRTGPEAVERLSDDPHGIVILSAAPLKNDEPISFPDGRDFVKPSELLAVLLRRVREYCARLLFDGRPLESCVLSLPHRSNDLRRVYSRIACEAGFSELHFRDMAISAETIRKNVWGDTFPFVTVCNLGAAQITFTLLKNRCGGSERVDRFHSVGIVGVDEIDRIILQSADPGNIAPQDSYDALYQLKTLRRRCSLEKAELFHFRLHGRKKRVRTVHFEVATKIFLQKMLAGFEVYADRAAELTGLKDIPIVMVGGGANNPLISQAIETVASGKVFWWAEAEEAIALGAAMQFLPKKKPENPTEEEDRFYRLYESAEAGNPESQCAVAKALETGNGTPISFEEAFDWYRLAAQNGSREGKFGMARLLFQGLGVIRDAAYSVKLLEESAKDGFAPSQFSLAMFLYRNKPDAAGEADAWLQQAVQKGYPEALAFAERRSQSPEGDVSPTTPGDWNMPAEVLIDE